MDLRPGTRLLVKAGVAAVLLAVLASQWSFFPKAFEAIGGMSWSAYGLALVVHVAIYVGRAARFRHFLPTGKPSLPVVFWIHSAHHLMATVLPARAGEISYVFYLNAKGNVPMREGMASLVASRLLDFAAGGAFFLGSIAIVGRALPGGSLRWGLAALAAFVLVVVGGVLAIRFGGSVLARGPIARWVARAEVEGTRGGLTRLLQRALGGAGGTLETLENLSSPKRLAGGAAISAAVWIGVYVYYGLIARALGFERPFPEIVFGATFPVFANVLPIAGIAGFGTWEAGWALGFALLGVAGEEAASSGLAVHLVTLVNVFAFGIVGHILMGLWGGAALEAEEAQRRGEGGRR